MLVRLGDVGEDVVKVTTELVRVGLLDEVTATFDNQVHMAVKAWQHHGIGPKGKPLKVDGIVGPNTWRSLTRTDAADLEKLPGDFEDLIDCGEVAPVALEALRVALREIDHGAREIGGNNKGPFVDKYHRRQSKGKGWAWCAAFVSWCFDQAADSEEVDMPFKYSGGAQNIHRQMKAKGWAYDVSKVEPLPGDVVVWWRGQTKTWKGHVGIVWGCVNDVVYVVEGNVGKFPAKVRVLAYDRHDIDKLIGFARVPAS